MNYEELKTPELLKLHDTMNHALGKFYELVNRTGGNAPAWVEDAAADVKLMYAELWARRSPATPSNSDGAGPIPAPEE